VQARDERNQWSAHADSEGTVISLARRRISQKDVRRAAFVSCPTEAGTAARLTLSRNGIHPIRADGFRLVESTTNSHEPHQIVL
jgi:hypothetical protein